MEHWPHVNNSQGSFVHSVIWSKSPSVIRLELFVDILGERVSVKTATREGPFNLQCKYLSISVAREEGVVGTEEEGQ